MLTQLTTLKARLLIDALDVTDDVLLTNMANHCSERFGLECNRVFDYGAGLTHEFRGDVMELAVPRPPVQAVTAFDLKANETDGWVAQTGVDYLWSPMRTLISLACPLGTSRELGRVTYTGGYILPGTIPSGNQVALPTALEQCCVEQVSYWYSRRNQLGLQSLSGEGGSLSNMAGLDLLPQVKAVLKKYERYLN